MYTKKQKAAVRIACTAFLLAALCFILFLVKQANHNCTGEDCPVCAQISEAENALKKLGTGDSPVRVLAAAAAIRFLFALGDSAAAVPCASPIAQKVRMND